MRDLPRPRADVARALQAGDLHRLIDVRLGAGMALLQPWTRRALDHDGRGHPPLPSLVTPTPPAAALRTQPPVAGYPASTGVVWMGHDRIGIGRSPFSGELRSCYYRADRRGTMTPPVEARGRCGAAREAIRMRAAGRSRALTAERPGRSTGVSSPHRMARVDRVSDEHSTLLAWGILFR